MIVRFHRDCFLGSMFIKARSEGVEIPDSIDGKPVVLFADRTDIKKETWLPKDAERLDAVVPAKTVKEAEVSLSQHTAKASKNKSFIKAMSKTDDDE